MDTLAVRGVRQITPLEADMATRLATLIDALYDAGGSLLLEVPGDGLETFTHVFVPLLAEAADLGVDIRLGSAFHASELVFRGTTAGHIAGDGSMASGVGHWEDQVLMWRRCASRVGEMCVEL